MISYGGQIDKTTNQVRKFTAPLSEMTEQIYRQK